MMVAQYDSDSDLFLVQVIKLAHSNKIFSTCHPLNTLSHVMK